MPREKKKGWSAGAKKIEKKHNKTERRESRVLVAWRMVQTTGRRDNPTGKPTRLLTVRQTTGTRICGRTEVEKKKDFKGKILG